MKDPNLALLNAYKTALAGMQFGTEVVPVYSRSTPLKNTAKKYVLLSSQTKTQNRTKCGYWYDCTITVDIVTRYPNGNGDITFAMRIGEDVADLVQVATLTPTNFTVVETTQLSSTDLAIETGSENIYRYIIIFQHKLNRA